MHVFCCGMLRSGSTWQYMVASHLLEAKKGGKRLGFMNDEQAFLDYDRTQGQDGSWQALKMHTPRQAFADVLNAGRAKALYSFRDLRDVVFSAIQMKGTTFDEFVLKEERVRHLIEHDAFWRAQPATLIQSYEDITQRPAESIRRIAQHLEVSLEAGEAEKLAAEFSLEENRKRAEALAEDRGKWHVFRKPRSFDPQTQLHWNHIQDGRSGRWHELATPAQVQHLATLCGAWLIERGFETSLAWAPVPAAALGGASEKGSRRLNPLSASISRRPRAVQGSV